MKSKYHIDLIGLDLYLKNIQYSEIETRYNKPSNPSLIIGEAIDDIEFFKLDRFEIPKDKIINYGEPFLVDALGNDLSVVILSRRKYKLPNGRVIRCKYVSTIIDDCRKQFGTPLNGYWKIPKQFLKIKKYIQP